jgi:hypothetical protein
MVQELSASETGGFFWERLWGIMGVGVRVGAKEE